MFVAASLSASAQEPLPWPSPSAPADERLLFEPIESVFAASRYEQEVGAAPSSITVLTAEDIERLGYTTLAEVLSAVRGFYATDDHNYTTLGVRGFARPGDFNTRVLLLLDGRRVNDPIYDQALVGTEGIVDVGMIERLEIVRGPGSSAYGANALFAVVNIVPKRGRAFKGVEIAVSGASYETGKARVSFGGRSASGFEGILSVAGYSSQGATFYFPELDAPETDFGLSAEGMDRDRYARLYGQASLRDLTLTVAYAWRQKRIPTGSWGVVFNDPRNETTDENAVVDLQWKRKLATNDTVSARVFYNRSYYDGGYVYDWAEPGGPARIDVLADYARGERWGAELLHTVRPLGRHQIVWGAELRDDFRQDQGLSSPVYEFSDERASRGWGLFAQDEFSVSKRLALTLGVRHDRYGDFGGTTNPRFAVIARPGAGSFVKLLYGRAYRPPNAYERFYTDGATQKANPDLASEEIATYEAVVEQALGDNWRASVSGYYYELEHLVSQTIDPADELLVFENAAPIEARGLETEVEGRFSSGFEVRASYSLQKARFEADDQTLSNSPEHLLKLHLKVPLVRQRLFLGAEGLASSSRLTLSGAEAPGFALVNVTLLGRRLLGGLDVSASVFNLFDESYGLPGGEEHVQDLLPQYGRSFRIRATVRF
jgi:iron complex outermembrane receptor protein